VTVVGHFENQWFVTEGIELAMRDIGADSGMEVMRVEHWEFCRTETLDVIFPDGFPGIALEHAAVIETSMMLHYHPELVSLDNIPAHGPAQFPAYDMYPARTAWVPSSGVLSSAKDSSREKGRLLVNDVVDGIATAVRHEFGLTDRQSIP
jgi:creatinine amidohydrolase